MGSIEPSSASTAQELGLALEEAHKLYTTKNPQSQSHHTQACQFLPGGNTRTVLHTTPFPLTIASGSGPTLTTLDNDTYIDFLGEYTAGIYGHNHPVIHTAIKSALSSGWNYGGHNAYESALAEVVVKRFAPTLELVRFVNSGTEANMMAIATALAYTGKSKILLFTKGYHGSTISGRTPSTKKSINLPHDFVVGTYNDVSGTEALVNDAATQGHLAAILVEPMLGSGGCYQATAEFLSTLRRLATQNNALLIFDEVMTSRLGYSGLGATTGVTPDLMTLGKWVGGGMSFGLFGGRRDIMQLYDPRSGSLEHPGTFNNNVFTMRAGLAGCALLTKEVINALNERGEDMKRRIETVLHESGVSAVGGSGVVVPTSPILDDRMHEAAHPHRPPKMFVKGVGSLMVIHFAGPDRDVLQGLYYHWMLQRGVYLAQRGFIALNILITDDHVATFVQALKSFVDKWRSALTW